MKQKKQQKLQAPFMPPVKRSAMVAKEVERMLQNHIMALWEFMESLWVTESNQSEFVVQSAKGEIEWSIRYTVYKASNMSTPLWSKTI